jgi:hypothetical protein
MQKVDLKKEPEHLYRASSRKVVEVDVPAFRFLMIDGTGDPNTSEGYAQAVEALFSVSYAAKFMVRNELQLCDYTVMPLEGLWWADDMSAFASGNRADWQWTMMIMQPHFVPEELIEAAIERTATKKQLSALAGLRLEEFVEGRCAQILHVGPFNEEGPTIGRLHEFIASRSGLTGEQHEIYLSDVRRAAPQNWKTIIRQPME